MRNKGATEWRSPDYLIRSSSLKVTCCRRGSKTRLGQLELYCSHYSVTILIEPIKTPNLNTKKMPFWEVSTQKVKISWVKIAVELNMASLLGILDFNLKLNWTKLGKFQIQLKLEIRERDPSSSKGWYYVSWVIPIETADSAYLSLENLIISVITPQTRFSFNLLKIRAFGLIHISYSHKWQG